MNIIFNSDTEKIKSFFSKKVCLIALSFISINCFAFDFDYNKQIYKVRKGTREVTLIKGYNAPDVIIPSRVFDEDDRGYRVVAISEKAYFNYKNLRSITFEGNVSVIGKNAFEGCDNLKEIHMTSHPARFSDSSFPDCKPDLFIPKGAIQKYRNAHYQKYFREINEVVKGEKPIVITVDNSTSQPKNNSNNSFICRVIPEAGWIPNTVTYNGKDITENFDSEYRCIGHPISLNSNFRASFEQTNKNSFNVPGNVILYSSGSNIIIKNLKSHDMIYVDRKSVV